MLLPFGSVLIQSKMAWFSRQADLARTPDRGYEFEIWQEEGSQGITLMFHCLEQKLVMVNTN